MTHWRQTCASASSLRYRAVKGVVTADEEDREVWLVTGTASGTELIETAARVVDELAGEIRAAMRGL